MFKLVLEKAEEPEIKLPTSIRWIMEKAREFQKNIYFCFIDYAKAFDCVDHKKLWERDGNTRPPDLPLEKPVCRSGSNSGKSQPARRSSEHNREGNFLRLAKGNNSLGSNMP